MLRLGGLLLGKCCDESSDGRQRMTHIDVYNMTLGLGLVAKDMFVLHRVTEPVVYGRQRVARNNHSYLWVLEKP